MVASFFSTYIYRNIVILALLGITGLLSSPQLRIEGNSEFSNRFIRESIQWPYPEDTLDVNFWEQWKKVTELNLQTQYEEEGYFDVKIMLEVQENRTESDLIISLKIEEGVRYQYGSVAIVVKGGGKPIVSLRNLRSSGGKNYNSEGPYRDKRDIEKIYGNAGFAKRKVQLYTYVNYTEKCVDVSFTIVPGYRVILDTLFIHTKRNSDKNEKNGISDPLFIQSLLDIQKGDTVSLNKTQSFKRKLKSTRLFNNVRIDDSLLQSTGESALTINLQERVPGKISGGVFWESLEGFGMEAGWAHKNILGQFYGLQILTRVAQRLQSINAGITSPLIFGSLFRFDNNIELIWRQFETFQEKIEFSPFDAEYTSSLSRPIGEYIDASSRVEFKRTSFEIINSPYTLNLVQAARFRYLNTNLNPSKGFSFLLNWGNGGSIVDFKDPQNLNQNRHNWVEMNSATYIPVLNHHVLAWRLDAGKFFGAGGINSRRFFQGGRNSVRHRNFIEVCPEVGEIQNRNEQTVLGCIIDVAPVYWLTTVEARIGVLKWVPIRPGSWLKQIQPMDWVLFSDVVRIWDSGKALQKSGETQNLGFGIRFPVSIFQLRFDYAVGLENTQLNWQDAEFVFDLSQSF